MSDYYKSGAWNYECQRCGIKYKSDQIRKEWTGLMVCGPCWEPRHPQDFLRAVKEDVGVPFSNKDSLDIYVGPSRGDSYFEAGYIEDPTKTGIAQFYIYEP